MKTGKLRFFLGVCSFLFGIFTLAAQTEGQGAEISDTYRRIRLGMDIEAVKKQLLADGIFGYRGDRDVSLLPAPNKALIETAGASFIERSWFQFHDGNLYIMTFKLNPERIDYYSVFSALLEKYGEPAILNPLKAVWNDERVTLSLERPLTVKYVDAQMFGELMEASGTEQAASDMLREMFISEF
ncbi:hypothetical protein K7I13_05065 [Brucepastera parasyntrophica]|uniref:hypothetical protein n=1 Tax=Brucepastera parasyntrophica TaxID=2880008 RepID=UPI00210D5DF8|nr:hypothetical protein [Brucepastera parasyntrophica]ULQ60648.1 hypothetical protein K7I13_05065 [Brucepastera parasyntrophica]